MNSLIEHIYKTQQVEDFEGNIVNPFPTSISYEVGLALYDLVRKTKASHTIELGMAYGLSSLFICQALFDNGGGHHIAIDPFERTTWKSIGLRNVKKAGLEHILVFHESPSDEMLPKLCRSQERFDCAFIDGNHRFDYVLLDFLYADKLLKVGGFMVFDDLWMPAIRKLCAFALRNRHYQLASVFGDRPIYQGKRFLKFARNVLQTPFDGYAICFSARLFENGALDCCVLQKDADDDRKWDDFHPF